MFFLLEIYFVLRKSICCVNYEEIFYSQWFTPCSCSNVFPGILQVKFPLFIPELSVGESVEMRVAQASKQSPGVVTGGQEVSVPTTFLLRQTLASSHHLGAQTSDTVSPRRADAQTLEGEKIFHKFS